MKMNRLFTILMGGLLLIGLAGNVYAGSLEAGAGTDLTFKTGDNAGANKISITDSGDAEVASIDSDGGILGGLVISSKTAATYIIGTDNATEGFGTLFINGDNDVIAFTLDSAIAQMSGCAMQGQGVTAAITVTPSSGDYLVSDSVRGTIATAYTSTGTGADKLCWVCVDATDCIITSETGTWSE